MPWLPRTLPFKDWPDDARYLPIERIIELYGDGFAGAKHDPEADERFKSSMMFPSGDAAAQQFGLADTGAGKLIVPFVYVQEMFPGCWPGPAQEIGDCVSHSTQNACLTTLACDVVSGQLDETTGKPEEKPDVPPEGIKQGVLSSEAFYWYRGYDGDGWSCPDAATVAVKQAGAVLRKNYADLGIDLTTYSGRLAHKYGRNEPPSNIGGELHRHPVHQATNCESLESVRDMLHSGYGVSTCGGEGYSDTRDDNGVSKQRGSWSHAMGAIGFDDRDWAKQTYGVPLVLILNSWAVWNGGPREIHDSAKNVPPDKLDLWKQLGICSANGSILIPEGSFWTPWNHAKNREFIAFSGVNGWPVRSLPLDNYF